MEKGQLFICAEDLNWKKMFPFDSSPNYSNSLGVDVDDDNRKLFEDFEEKLQSLTGDGELKLIKYDRVYLKIYVNDKGEMVPKILGGFLAKMGRAAAQSKGLKAGAKL